MNQFKTLMAIAMVAVLSVSAFAQKSFEGTVTYGITYEDLDETMAAYESMLPKEMIYKFKGDKNKMIQPSAMGETVVITDMASKKTSVLMDMMGKKMVMEKDLTKEEKSTEGVDVKYIDETTTIAGYKCKKAEISSKESEDVVIVWYTADLVASSPQFKTIKGFPMKYETSQNGMTMTMEVKTVKEEKISKGEFTVPKEYEKITEEDLKKMMGGEMK